MAGRFALARTLALVAVIISLVLTSVLPAYAQAGGSSGNVSGTVQNDQGQPVAGATVGLASPSGSFTRTTDDHGFFSFLGVPTDTYTLSIEAPGFNTYSQTGVTITGTASQSLGLLHLTPVTRVIGTVIAHSLASAFQPNQTIPQYTISGNVLQAAAGKAATSNEDEVLLAVPGFQFDAYGNLILQGATRDQIRYQFDGVDFTDPGFAFSANNSFFNGISSVQVVSGAGDPSQGDGGAGTVNLIVKRGTYPPGGLLDVEVNDRPEGQQVNFQYGAATQNGKFSDFVSYFGANERWQFGPWGTPGFVVNTNPDLNQRQEDSDFVNNFVYRFGPDNNQSLQALYMAHATTIYGNNAGIPLVYDNDDPATVATLEGNYPGLTAGEVSSLLTPQLGQTYIGQPIPGVAGIDNSSLLKFAYTNQFNDSTSLTVRFFHSDVFNYESPAGDEDTPGSLGALCCQTSGGSRTGANFDLVRQIGEKDTLTFSGNYEFNRPNFGAYDPETGFYALGPNVIDFLRPANPDLPVSATNPCPIAGGCYLQQFFYTQGGTPTVPGMYLQSSTPNVNYGVGVRDELQMSQQVRVDLGLHYDLFNQFLSQGYITSQNENTQPVPGSPSTFYIPNFGFVNEPHYIEPRLGISDLVTPHDTIAYTFGKSISLGGNGLYASPEAPESFLSQFAAIPVNPNWMAATGTATGSSAPIYNPNNPTQLLCNAEVPYPIGATSSSNPSYNGTVAGATPSLQFGKPCASYEDALYDQLNFYWPEIENIQPAVLYNNDLSYAHVFGNGLALKLDAFNRQAYHTQLTSAPLIYNPVTGQTTPGSLVTTSTGQNQTTGLDFNVTLPDRPYGVTGFVSVSYTNEFTNTPADADNPYDQDFEPFSTGAYAAVTNFYKAGFVSPLTLRVGLSYKTKSGWRINPILNVNDGYPYNAGNLAPYLLPNGSAVNVPNTNVTDPYQAYEGGNPFFVDPANPGSIYAPTIAATRGNTEGAAGSDLSPPLATMDLVIEYSPPSAPRNTFGFQIIDLFNNAYFQHPFPNGNWYPVSTGVSGPLSGQFFGAVLAPAYGPLVATDTYPYAPYIVPPYFGSAVGTPGTPFNENLPMTFRVYYQLKL